MSLDGADDPALWDALEGLLATMECKGVGLAKMTKLLCQKRPALIPMLDSYVMGFLFKSEWPAVRPNTYAKAGVEGMKQFRALLLHGNNLAATKAISEEMNAWLADRVEDRTPPHLSPVRVLDSLLWFDWWGFTAFGWVEADGEIRKA